MLESSDCLIGRTEQEVTGWLGKPSFRTTIDERLWQMEYELKDAGGRFGHHLRLGITLDAAGRVQFAGLFTISM